MIDVSEFPHNAARADHRESYDRICKRAMQNEANRSRLRGKAQPISDLSPVGQETTTLIGQFVSRGPLSEWREVPSSIAPVLAQYRTVEGCKPVYELILEPVHRPTGTPADNERIPHTFKDLFDAPLQAGDWLALVFQGGEVAKVIRAGDQCPIVDTSLDFTLDEDSAIGARFGSYAPARPWSLGLAVEFILEDSPSRAAVSCAGTHRAIVEDFTLSCPNCTRGLRYSAELLLIERGIDPEIAFAVLSRLETDWLLSQIPKEVEVPA